MGLVFEQIKTEGLAQLSYLVGDDSAGVAAIIDPRRDVDIYLEKARVAGVRITHIIETHIHADFVSGSHELQARIGAKICGGKSLDYQFELQQLTQGDEIELGKVKLQVLHTPGHTPEHITLQVFDAQQGEQPFGIFTGDTLFNLDVGRPDLSGTGTEKELASKLYHSLFDVLVPLGDRVEVYPCHGAGSACGKSIGDRAQSTIGNERIFSDAFQKRSEAEFIDWILGDLPEAPRYYFRLKKVNAQGAKVTGCVPTLQPLSPADFQAAMEDENTLVIDTRSMLAFGGGHIPGAINIGFGSSFTNWIGWIIDADKKLLLVTEDTHDVTLVTDYLYRIGYDNLFGYLRNGMSSWSKAGLPLQHLGEWSVHELNEHLEQVTVLDVRSDSEYAKGRIPGAKHIYVPHLEENFEKLDKTQAIATYCGSGYRASIAASLLEKNGFENVINIPGSWSAWKTAGLPVEQ
ncbi:MBL fold metallo-hydrolase [Oscillatoria salina]|uniref:MBL fold metallo-hydrolase n=1 Tax=Oscillatoria salina TaxID=331517 RepID=UPI0013BCDC0A|nr:MBL fold metallo-hydrolase [Oscillatoria salina]MBZ8178852.1 MBL fold metallo-hydrolase [Oscillatoria salina IIICB1]NET87625.1 MBL fold metallo-hydrolase [Kamptonema sp. SIO1D9]